MSLFINKSILYFAPSFFKYELEIKTKLEQLGSKVILYDERPSNSIWVKAMIRLFPSYSAIITNRYYETLLKKNKNEEFDYIFFLKGETLNKALIEKIREYFPNSKLILYLIDSIKNYPHLLSCVTLMDKVLSFDLFDSESLDEIIFRPLFYLDDYTKTERLSEIIPKNDIFFIGTIHSDRWFFLKKIKKWALNKHFSILFYLYFQHILIYIFRKVANRSYWDLSLNDVYFKSLTKEQIVNCLNNSKVVVDIQHPKQTGLTIRTIEVFGAGRKIITTNRDIKKYDIYNSNNILLVDRFDPIIDETFINEPYISPSPELYLKYSLKQWLLDVFN